MQLDIALQNLIKSHQMAVGEALGLITPKKPDSVNLMVDSMVKEISTLSGFAFDQSQVQLVKSMLLYILNPIDYSVFILQGAAGTGKTSLTAAFITWLKQKQYFITAVAPTGRAAKVLEQKLNHNVTTIHKLIYSLEEIIDNFGVVSGFDFCLKENNQPPGTIFFVDEASMIAIEAGNEQFLRSKPIFDDLLSYVFQPNPDNKLIFIGDVFQLPPVGEEQAKALNPNTFEKRGINAVLHQLEKVQRQAKESAILLQANLIRETLAIGNEPTAALVLPHDDSEIFHIYNIDEAVKHFVSLYENSPDEVVFLTSSNKMAQVINKKIRKLRFGQVHEIPQKGEPLLLVKNHYFREKQTMNYWANGEIAYFDAIKSEKEQILNLDFAEVSVQFHMAQEQKWKNYQHKAVLNLLQSTEASLSIESQRMLYLLRKKVSILPLVDPYLNALQLKFGYAFTVHKAQGGEWPIVFLLMERNYGNNFNVYLKWFYTAVTRAKKQLFLVQPV